MTALIVTLALYPGWFFFDSAQQWAWARLFVVDGWPSHLRDYMVTTHWPIFNTIINVPFYWLTHEAGLYAFVQALTFNIALFLVGRALIGRRSWWLLVFTAVMVLSPISMNMSVFQSSDTVVATCVLVAVAMIVDDGVSTRRRAFWVGVAVVLMSLLRYNALTTAIPLVVVFCWVARAKWSSARSAAVGAAMLLAIVFSVAAARAYEHTAYKDDSAPEGPALRLLEASRLTTDPVVHAVVDDRVAANPQLREPLQPACYVAGYWCAQIGGPWKGLSTHRVLRAYVHLLVHHPVVFLRVNAPFVWYGLGLGAPVEARQLGRTDIAPPFPAARMVFNHRRTAMLSAFQATLDWCDGLAARTAIVFLLGLAVALGFRRPRLGVAYVVLAVGYATPILLLASDANFRYLFPVTITGMAITAAGGCVAVRRVLRIGPIPAMITRARGAVSAPWSGRAWVSRWLHSQRKP